MRVLAGLLIMTSVSIGFASELTCSLGEAKIRNLRTGQILVGKVSEVYSDNSFEGGHPALGRIQGVKGTLDSGREFELTHDGDWGDANFSQKRDYDLSEYGSRISLEVYSHKLQEKYECDEGNCEVLAARSGKLSINKDVTPGGTLDATFSVDSFVKSDKRFQVDELRTKSSDKFVGCFKASLPMNFSSEEEISNSVIKE